MHRLLCGAMAAPIGVLPNELDVDIVKCKLKSEETQPQSWSAESDLSHLLNNSLHVKSIPSNETSKSSVYAGQSYQTTTCFIYVQFTTRHDYVNLRDEDVSTQFCLYGCVKKISLHTTQRVHPQSGESISLGYAFVYFEGSSRGKNAAIRATEALSKAVIHGVRYNCELVEFEGKRFTLVIKGVPHEISSDCNKPVVRLIRGPLSPLYQSSKEKCARMKSLYGSLSTEGDEFHNDLDLNYPMSLCF